MADDAYVQIAPDSSGKKVRNRATTLVLSTGAEHAVYSQAVVPYTADGQPFEGLCAELSATCGLILTTLQAMQGLLELLAAGQTKQAAMGRPKRGATPLLKRGNYVD